MKTQLNLLVYEDCDSWVAQCLEYDIAAQATTLPDLEYEIQRVLIGRIYTAKQLGIEPFEGLPPAPDAYRRIFEDHSKIRRLELKPTKNLPVEFSPAFALPTEAFLYA